MYDAWIWPTHYQTNRKRFAANVDYKTKLFSTRKAATIWLQIIKPDCVIFNYI